MCIPGRTPHHNSVNSIMAICNGVTNNRKRSENGQSNELTLEVHEIQISQLPNAGVPCAICQN